VSADRIPIKVALLSVWRKDGLLPFARSLVQFGVKILSTGGTYRLLRSEGIEVESVEEYTGQRELFSGRVKTLHPKIHAGILAREGSDMEELFREGILPIDLVVVNLYPFEEVVQEEGKRIEEILEMIDIGGHTLIRGSAKNFFRVAVVVDPEDYGMILSEIEEGGVTLKTRRYLAEKAFIHTAYYDGVISSWFSGKGPLFFKEPREEWVLPVKKSFPLRYGENPHQRGYFATSFGVSSSITLLKEGKKLSYNNFLDLDRGLRIVLEMDQPAVAIIKHTNPCGVAVGENGAIALEKALSTDPVSAFGSVIVTNAPITKSFVKALGDLFVECLLGPEVEEGVEELLEKRKGLRLLTLSPWPTQSSFPLWELRVIFAGILFQERDIKGVEEEEWKVVTEKKPTLKEEEDLRFAMKVCRHIVSNGIVLARNGQTLGIGAGQMSRVDAVKIAIEKSRFPLKGAVCASDAFFPFPDGVELLGREGISAIAQPGGSIRDKEVIATAEKWGIGMVFTGTRHFRH